jgi:hypothetical protein
MSCRRILLSATLLLACACATIRPARAQVLDPGFPVTDFGPQTLRLKGDTLYVGGWIGYIGPPNGSMAAIENRSGALAEHWPPFLGQAFAVVPDGAGGCFVSHAPSVVAGVPRGALTHIRADGTLDSLSLAHFDAWFRALAVRGRRLYFAGSVSAPERLHGSSIRCLDLETGELVFTVPYTGGGMERLLLVDSTLFVAGDFSSIAGTIRSGLAAIDAQTGALRDWSVPVAGTVHALAHAGTTMYFGGHFSSAGGAPRSHLAAADIRTGALTPFHPMLDGTVLALVADGTSVFAGGNFRTASGTARAGLAAWRHDGALRTDWIPNPSVPAFTWGPEVWSLALAGDTLFLGGRFTSVGGLERTNLAAVSRTSGTTLGWTCHASQMVLAHGKDGSRLFARSGPGGSFGGAVRHGLAAVDVRTNRILDWAPRIEPDLGPDPTVWEILPVDDRVLVTGRFGWANGEWRLGFAAFDVRTGALRPERCDTDGYSRAADVLLAHDSTLYIGGYFDRLAGVARTGLGALDSRTLAVKPWAPRPAAASGPFSLPAGTHAFVIRDSTMFVHGAFDSIGGVARRAVAEIRLSDGGVTRYSQSPGGRWASMIGVGEELWFGGRVDGDIVRTVPMADTSSIETARIEGDGQIYSLERQSDVVWAAGSFKRRTSWTSADYDSTAQLTAFDVATKRDLAWTHPFAFIEADNVGGRTLQANSTALFGGGDFALDASQGGDRRTLFRALRPDSAPPHVTLLAPQPGDEVIAGMSTRVLWGADDDSGIWSVDLYLSRTGSAGPWTLVAAGITERDGYGWRVPAETVTSNAMLRVVARDWGGALGTAQSEAAFAIVDAATPGWLERFRARRVENGVRVEWALAGSAALARTTIERAESNDGEYMAVDAPLTSDGHFESLLDTRASVDRAWWYRLRASRGDGSTFRSEPIPVEGDLTTMACALNAPSPNPTRGTSRISYALPVRSRVRITLLDVQGRERAQLVNGERPAGRHAAELDARELPPGLYWIRMQAPGADVRRKFVIVR